MKVYSYNRTFTLLLLFLFYSNFSICQGTITATYNEGDIPTGFNGGNWDPECNGASSVLSVTLPAGFEFQVTGIDISYDMIASGNLWMSGQNSQIHCQNTNTSEAAFSEGTGDMTGTENFSRTSINIGNGTYAGGTSLNFEMRAWRDYQTGTRDCSSVTGKIANGTWTISMHYSAEITPPRVGINKSNPKATLDVGGEIIIGDDGNQTEAGMIKFSNGFYGFDGNSWKSLTSEFEKRQTINIPGIAFYPSSHFDNTNFNTINAESGSTHSGGRSYSGAGGVYPLVLPVGSSIDSITYHYLDNEAGEEVRFDFVEESLYDEDENGYGFFRTISLPDSPAIRTHTEEIYRSIRSDKIYWIYCRAGNGSRNLGVKAVSVFYRLP